mmetsp:Transcript_65955/g.192974  ORF Transcript_65955/g.192974 Transcript_65955/m.192974 type:complete len:209 (-) Transcript_65955:2980-3606(-)
MSSSLSPLLSMISRTTSRLQNLRRPRSPPVVWGRWRASCSASTPQTSSACIQCMETPSMALSVARWAKTCRRPRGGTGIRTNPSTSQSTGCSRLCESFVGPWHRRGAKRHSPHRSPTSYWSTRGSAIAPASTWTSQALLPPCSSSLCGTRRWASSLRARIPGSTSAQTTTRPSRRGMPCGLADRHGLHHAWQWYYTMLNTRVPSPRSS